MDKYQISNGLIKLNGKRVSKTTWRKYVNGLKKLKSNDAAQKLYNKWKSVMDDVNFKLSNATISLIYQIGQDENYTERELEAMGCIPIDKSEALQGVKKVSFFKELNLKILKLIKDKDFGPHSEEIAPAVAMNYESQNIYKGINKLIIQLQTKDTYFLTENQIKKRGGNLKRGADPIVVAAFIKTKYDIIGGKRVPIAKGQKAKDEANTSTTTAIVTHTIYGSSDYENVAPIRGRNLVQENIPLFEDIASASEIKDGYIKREKVIFSHGGSKSYYSSAYDKIKMASKKSFETSEAYYRVVFHEMAHSTGHARRLKRDLSNIFGSKLYAQEELIAELSSSYLMNVLGLAALHSKYSAKYLDSWSKVLTREIKGDPRFFFNTSIKAMKAMKMIAGPYWKKYENSIKNYERKKNKKTPVKKATVKKATVKKATVKKATVKKTRVKKAIVTAKQLKNMEYSSVKMNKVWGDFFGTVCRGFDAVFYGAPGSRKTTMLLMLADDLATVGHKVAFVTSEEFGSPTLSLKLEYLKLGDDVEFAGDLNDITIANYDVVFIDSITDMGMTIEEYKTLKKENPTVSFISILQFTKSGTFMGGNKWPHTMDIQIQVNDGKTETIKNRYKTGQSEIDLNV